MIAAAEQIPFPELRVVKKPGEQTGSALVTIKGKPKILARHGVQAWQIMDNEIVLVAARKKTGGDEYHLRFYEGISREYRDLGTMPFAATELVQAKHSDDTWVFALTGTYVGKPTIALTGMNVFCLLTPGSIDLLSCYS